MLILNRETIEETIQPKGMVDAIKQAFLMYRSGSFLMPDRMHVSTSGNTLLLMPAFIKNYFGTKLVSVFPENINKNEPVIYGTMVLNDAKTGKPLAIIDGSALTAHRTGAVGAFAAKALASKNMHTFGIVGAGVQSLHQALYISQTIDIKELLVFDIYLEKAKKWVSDLKTKLPSLKITIADSTKALCKNSSIIVTATTSNKPVLPDEQELFKNKLLLAFGSYKPNMKELSDAVFANAQVFIDTEFAKIESGDLAQPIKNGLVDESQIKLLATILDKKNPVDYNKTTIFKSVGMALFDLAVSSYLFNEAKNKNIGLEVDF